MNNRIIASIVVVLLIVVGYLFLTRETTAPTRQETANSQKEEDADGGKDKAVYLGRTPCADCEGIDVKLALKENGKYKMTNTYLGKDAEPIVDKGTWTTKKGDSANPDAEVYILTPESGQVMNFVLEGTTLKQLDENLQPMTNNPYTMTLTQKK